MTMRIISQLQTLDQALNAWKRYQSIPAEQFSRDPDTQYMVCHAMLISIQSAIDIATGIAVMKTPKRPDTYRETFKVLGVSGFLPPELANELSRLAGFRNILVHEYTGLDTDRVYAILQKDWQVLDAFRKRVKEIVREQKG